MPELSQDIAERLPLLTRYARYLTRNESDAEDLVHDCVERAIRRQDQFRPGTNLDAWLRTIMRNVFINQKRHEKLITRHAQQERLKEESQETPAQMHAMELSQVLGACDKLSQDHQMALRLLCLDQKSYKAAAREMGIPVATAKTRLFRARERLRAQCAA